MSIDRFYSGVKGWDGYWRYMAMVAGTLGDERHLKSALFREDEPVQEAPIVPVLGSCLKKEENE
jgi:hypothetical protein